ncbi:MAG: BRO family protein [Burkholderia gladioli]
MSNIVPFEFEGHAVRVVTDENGELLFVGKDVAEALGYVNHADAITKHCKGIAKRYPLQTPGGKQEVRVLTEGDMFRLVVNSTLSSAEKFERLVFDEILPTIRKTGSYGTSKDSIVPEALAALKLAPLAVRAARSFGLDKNSAAISANQYVRKLTGINLLEGLGQSHLAAENQETQYFTPTELGTRIDVSARKFNLLLAEAGFQAKRGDEWEVLDAGRDFARIYDTGKKHGSGVPIQQIKWAANVLPMLKPVEAEQ